MSRTATDAPSVATLYSSPALHRSPWRKTTRPEYHPDDGLAEWSLAKDQKNMSYEALWNFESSSRAKVWNQKIETRKVIKSPQVDVMSNLFSPVLYFNNLFLEYSRAISPGRQFQVSKLGRGAFPQFSKFKSHIASFPSYRSSTHHPPSLPGGQKFQIQCEKCQCHILLSIMCSFRKAVQCGLMITTYFDLVLCPPFFCPFLSV